MANSFSTTALVLRKTKLAETDLILTLLAADGSQLRAVAKGGRKPGSKLCGIAEPFVVFDGLFHLGKNLDVIREAKVVAAHYPLRSDYDRAQSASIVVDVLSRASEQGEPVPRLYALSAATLDVLDSAPIARLPLVVDAFLLKAMAMLGYSPQFELCGRDERLLALFNARLTDVPGLAIQNRSMDVLTRKIARFIDRNLPAHVRTLDAWR
jgi:DNA repair protein RecO (recombination protein O)